jgi:hypothetical protein
MKICYNNFDLMNTRQKRNYFDRIGSWAAIKFEGKRFQKIFNLIKKDVKRYGCSLGCDDMKYGRKGKFPVTTTKQLNQFFKAFPEKDWVEDESSSFYVRDLHYKGYKLTIMIGQGSALIIRKMANFVKN